MDFFEAQDRAKRNTGKLVFFYILAVTGIVLSVYMVSLTVFYWQFAGFENVSWWNPVWLLAVSAIIFSVIALGTIFRVIQLRKGGSAVAELLGGRRVEPSTTDAAEQRLMNVVEEMAIASGLAVPEVYVLDNEENINAFAAGFGTSDAAVGVTRGTLEQLTRDELQGVIAHEFSHIFNGDMRLNIRLIGILNGILLIHMMGLILMRSVMYSGGARVKSRGGKDGGGNATIVIIVMGLALVIIGYIGMIFGRMIQSAISRQREYLADAAAVQYTRNPEGLAGALKKIGQKKKGAKINNGHAMEMSHLFFASSFHSLFDSLFATHPPIEKRIKAISPSLAAGDQKTRKKIHKKFQKQHVSGSVDAGGTADGTMGHAALTPEVILAAIGTLDRSHVNRTSKLLKEIPETLRRAAHEPFEAEALIIALLLSSANSEKDEYSSRMKDIVDDEAASRVQRFIVELEKAKREWFLPLAELAFPALRQMSENQYREFRSVVEKLVSEFETENLFAFALEKMIVRQLDSAFSKVKDPEVRHHNFKSLGQELTVLLSSLAHLSGEYAPQAWNAGLKPIEKVIPEGVNLLGRDQYSLEDLNKALDEFAVSANPVKKYLLSAVIHCVVSDEKITIKEKELVRAISEGIDCPIPLGAMGG